MHRALKASNKRPLHADRFGDSILYMDFPLYFVVGIQLHASVSFLGEERSCGLLGLVSGIRRDLYNYILDMPKYRLRSNEALTELTRVLS